MQIPIQAHRGQKKPFGSMPRINWQHPLTRGLVFYGYQAGGGYVVDLVQGLVGTDNAAVAQGLSPFGSANRYVSAGSFVTFPNSAYVVSIFPASLYSFATAWFITTLPSVTFTCPFGVNDTSGNNACALLWDNSASTDMSVVVGNTTSANFSTNSINTFHSLVCTNTAATAQRIYFDGVLNTTSALTAAFTATAYRAQFNSAQVGGSGLGNGVIGLVYYGALWNRTISAAEARQLHDNPYAFLIYPEDEIFATLVGTTTGLTNNIPDLLEPHIFKKYSVIGY